MRGCRLGWCGRTGIRTLFGPLRAVSLSLNTYSFSRIVKKVQVMLRTVAVAGLVVSFAIISPTIGAASDLIQRLRDASKALAVLQLNPNARDRFVVATRSDPTTVLLGVASAQLRLKDVNGARSTAAVFPLRKIFLRGDIAYKDFRNELLAELFREGKQDQAESVIRDLCGYNHLPLADALAVSRILVTVGTKSTARQLIQKYIADSDTSRSIVDEIELASMQALTGDRRAGLKACRQLEERNGISAASSDDRCKCCARLALLYSKLGELQTARGQLSKAAELAHDDGCWHLVADVCAEIGDIDGAMRTAARVEKGSRTWLYLDIALVRLCHDDFDAAEKIVRSESPIRNDRLNLMLVEIAKGRARANNLEGAVRTVCSIESEPRRTQGLLEVSAVLAGAGNRSMALTLLKRVAMCDHRRAVDGKAMVFNVEDAQTWRVPPLIAMTSGILALRREQVSDLAAAAVCCRTALGKGVMIPYFEGRNVSDWDVRKIGAAEASQGDLDAALAWCSTLSEDLRIAALLGIAEGEVSRRELAQNVKFTSSRLWRPHPFLDDPELLWASFGAD
jgi:tetratricopeptide (TPR) repeat protein